METKSVFVTEVLKNSGFGGGIHHFKNYVLRGDVTHYEKAKRSLNLALKNVEELTALKNSSEEREAFRQIQDTFENYIANLEVVKRLYDSGEQSVEAVDKSVKIDDVEAIAGLNLLLDGYQESLAKLKSTDTVRSLFLLFALTVLLLLLGYLYLGVIASLDFSKEKLRLANDELIQFSFRTSHDLKSPLTTSKRLAEFIAADIDGGDLEEAKENSLKIFNQMENLEKLVADILNLAKADFENDEPERFRFEDLVADISKRLHWDDSADGDFTCDIGVDREVSGSKVRFTQVLENLISNGFKYRDPSKKKSYVAVGVNETADNFKIAVEDNGLGIPEKQGQHVFEMFKRFHPKAASGSGLGLSLVKKHVEYMGGTISFTSSEQGTRFDISIPKGDIR